MKVLALLAAGAMIANAQSPFDQLVDQYFNEHFEFSPSEATADGFHQYDSKLEDYSRRSMQAEVAMDRKYLAKFESMPQSDDRDWCSPASGQNC